MRWDLDVPPSESAPEAAFRHEAGVYTPLRLEGRHQWMLGRAAVAGLRSGADTMDQRHPAHEKATRGRCCVETCHNQPTFDNVIFDIKPAGTPLSGPQFNDFTSFANTNDVR